MLFPTERIGIYVRDIRSAPYEISSRGGTAPEASIDFDNSKNVLPVTSYVPEAGEGDEYLLNPSKPAHFVGSYKKGPHPAK